MTEFTDRESVVLDELWNIHEYFNILWDHVRECIIRKIFPRRRLKSNPGNQFSDLITYIGRDPWCIHIHGKST